MINVFLLFPSNKGWLNISFGSTYPSLPYVTLDRKGNASLETVAIVEICADG